MNNEMALMISQIGQNLKLEHILKINKFFFSKDNNNIIVQLQ